MHTGIIPPDTTITVDVTAATALRIDSFLQSYFPDYSRSFFQKLIEQQHITLNGKPVKKPSVTVAEGDMIAVHFPQPPAYYTDKTIDPALDVRVLFTHPHFLIVQKPPNLMVHAPSATHQNVTLVDWLIKHFEEIKHVGAHDRPGIVHRLDKDTSGLMIVPRNDYALNAFQKMFKDRTIQKTYLAIVHGHPKAEGTINLKVGRDSANPTKMTHLNPHGRPATTTYHVVEYFPTMALLELHPTTGRTHQLRVHCAALGYPIVGDAVYGTKSPHIQRQALHAYKLAFTYDDVPYEFTSELPDDMKELCTIAKTLHDKNSTKIS